MKIIIAKSIGKTWKVSFNKFQ